MEVHHHSHHPKKWKEYIQEFLMLFFAVFLGFMSEYYLEYRAERHKEHDYLSSMVKDLHADLDEMSSKDKAMDELMSSGNKITAIIYKPNWEKTDIDSIYLNSIVMVTRFVNLNFSSGTIDQLRNAGGFRLIQNEEIVSKISDYEKGKVAIRVQQEAMLERWARVHEMQNKILHLNVFEAADKMGKVNYNRETLEQIISRTGKAFLTTDKNTFYEYSNYVNVCKGYVAFYEIMSKMQQQKAKELIQLIEKDLAN
ncbi:hypothetical protein V7S79_01075 [Aquirufa sp. ROCK-SH2]